MKKILYVALSIITSGIWVASCTNGGSGGNAEKLREDSIRIADSIAEEETARTEALQAAEQARLDSIRRDSIERVQKYIQAFTPSLFITKSEGWWRLKDNIPSSLKKIGFTLSQKKLVKDLIEYSDGETVDGFKVTYVNNEIGVTVSWGFHIGEWSKESNIVTDIEFAFTNPELENMFVTKIKQMGLKKEDSNSYWSPDGCLVFINRGNGKYSLGRFE